MQKSRPGAAEGYSKYWRMSIGQHAAAARSCRRRRIRPASERFVSNSEAYEHLFQHKVGCCVHSSPFLFNGISIVLQSVVVSRHPLSLARLKKRRWLVV